MSDSGGHSDSSGSLKKVKSFIPSSPPPLPSQSTNLFTDLPGSVPESGKKQRLTASALEALNNNTKKSYGKS
ncbi:MAG: hypothetical protein WCK49_10450 [Myxococcaceae bacterium]